MKWNLWDDKHERETFFFGVTIFVIAAAFLVLISVQKNVFREETSTKQLAYEALNTLLQEELMSTMALDLEIKYLLDEVAMLEKNAALIAALDPLDFIFSPIEIIDLIEYIPKGNPFESEWYLTSRYGSDAGHGGNPRYRHRGQDFVPYGSWNVHPIANGKVIDIGIGEYEGKWIIVEHNKYTRTKIQHLEKIFFTALPGEEVTPETIIGIMGSTGFSDGAHAHMEIHVFNGEEWKVIDPFPYITGERKQ